MLRKLFKYEFIACVRQLAPLYAGILIFAAAFRIFLGASTSMWLNITTFAAIFMALMLMVYRVLDKRFEHTVTGVEGYLTLTMPLKTSTLIWGKFLCAVTYGAISLGIMIIACVIAGKIPLVLQTLYTGDAEMVSLQASGSFWLTIAHGVVAFIAEMAALQMLSCLSTSIGMATSGWHYVLSRVIFLVLYVAMMVIPVNMFLSGQISNLVEMIFQGNIYRNLNLAVGMIELLSAIVIGVSFCGINYILKNKVNLN